MRVYLAGAMTSIPFFNLAAFEKATEKLREQGHEVFNPVENDADIYGYEMFTSNPTGDAAKAQREYDFDIRQALGDDLAWLCMNADAIALLPGWRNSKGATAEHATAVALGLKIIELEDDI